MSAQAAIRREAEAQMESVTDQDEFSGRLNVLSLSDIYQLVNSTGKTGTLLVSNETGEVISKSCFDEGDLVGASFEELTGDEACLSLLRKGGASFVFDPDPPTILGGIQKNVMTLLMESAQDVDES